jgi:hypothetical protein
MRLTLLTLTLLLLSSFQTSIVLAIDAPIQDPQGTVAPAPSPNPYLQDVPVDITSGLGRDHAALEEDQSPKVQRFVKKYFRDEVGTISLEKVEAFLQKLQVEREKLRQDLFESTVLERVEVDIFSQYKAREHADSYGLSADKIIDLYDRYLIPTIERLENLIKNNEDLDQWEGLLHDFIRAYHGFFSPTSNVTMWRENDVIPKIIKGFVSHRKIKKNDPKKNEAINLIVEAENLTEIQRCLGNDIVIGHYLTKKEIQTLKDCKYDLSFLNPGVSALWEKRSQADIENFKTQDFDVNFPAEGARLVFREVMITGGGSPKVEVKDQATGKKYKIKWGVEAHVDNSVGNILYMLGLNIDVMQHRTEVKVHLGKKNFTQFMSLVQAKYFQPLTNHTILGHGGPPGDEWIILKDVMIEARPEDDSVKTTAFDPTTMDFNERREFNGKFLCNIFLNLVDNKIANMKMLLAPSKRSPDQPENFDTRPRVLLRMKDLGYAFGPALTYNKLKNVTAIGYKYLPEAFEENGMISLNKKKTKLTIKWNDLHLLTGFYEHVTYFDLKWMARKIANLRGDDIEWSLIQGGMPVGVAKIYRSKLISRRNEIIKVFELEDDPDFQYPEETPDLAHLNYQGNEEDGIAEVVNGKINRSHYKGRQVFLHTKSTILYNIITQAGTLVNALISTLSLSPGQTFQLGNNLSVNPKLLSVQTAGGNGTSQLTLATPTAISLGVGLNATLSRQVLISPDLHTDLESKARPYFVRDTLILSIGVGTPYLAQLLPYFPVHLNASINAVQITYEYDHYTENYLKGFITSPMPFLRSLTKPIEQAATQLDRMEVIRRSYTVGLSGGVSATLFQYSPVTFSSTQVGLGTLKLYDRSYFRDQFGLLHVFTQNTHEHSALIDLKIADFSNPAYTRLPLIGYQNSFLSYKTEQKDLIANTGREEYSNDDVIEDNDGRLREDLIKLSSKRPTPLEDLSLFKQNFKLTGEGKVTYHEKIFFFKGSSKEKRRAIAEITYSDGHQKKLNLHGTKRDRYLGVSSNRTIVPFMDLTVKNAERVNINVEVDEHDYPGSVIILRVLNFFRHGNREDLSNLIQSLNRRFSINADTPFYRNYNLPEADDVDNYRKVYGVTRIYISTAVLLDKIALLSSDSFKEMAHDFFLKQEEEKTQIKSTDLGFFKRFFRTKKIKDNTRSLVKHFEALKEESLQLNRDFTKIPAIIDKFIFYQKIHEYGTSLLLKLTGEDSLYLSGDIGGVFPSFSVANDLQERQRRRFAAKHWGNLNTVAPVQFHNRYERVLYSSDLVPIHISQDAMLGTVTNGYPEELKTVPAIK